MSERYQAGIITKTTTTPTGPYATGAAPGVWTLDQQLQYQQQGVWPTAGLFPSYIEDVFSTYLYTGNGSTQTITTGIDTSTKGGLVWLKDRTAANSHFLFDTTRTSALFTNTSNAAGSGYVPTYFNFGASGFYVDASGANYNVNGNTYASWTFRKQAKFFDVVTYTGNGTAGLTVSHSLGSAPGFIVVKRTDAAGAWTCFHTSLGGTKAMFLNATNAVQTNIRYWNDTAPTSSVFTLGFDTDVNASGGTYVAYLFAHDAGGFGASGSDNVISCGSGTSNGSGVINPVTLGYEPQFIIAKATGTTSHWFMFDVMRGDSLTSVSYLRANTSDAETTTSTPYIYPTATGFAGSGNFFGANEPFIYIAIRRGPMRTPTSGTSVFQAATYAGNNSTTTGQDVSTNFPMDFAFTRYNRAGAGDWDAISRLQGLSNAASGSRYLNPYNTNAEATGGYLWQTSQLLLKMYGFPASTTQLNYFFRRAPGFFDEVCYTGNGTSGATQSHNLAAVPEMWIVKRRSTADYWVVGTSARGSNVVELNTNGAEYDAGTAYFSNGSSYTAPTSTAIRLGSNARVNASGDTYVAYLFATVAGVSKVGSYTGTGTTLQVNCGFTGGARFVLIKRTDSTGDWYVWDSARGIVAGNDPYLLLNSTAAEVTNTDYVDTYSAGFEISSTAPAAINANGGSFIFLAIS